MFRPARGLLVSLARIPCTCRPAQALAPLRPSLLLPVFAHPALSRSYAAKKKSGGGKRHSAKEEVEEVDDDVAEDDFKGKGKKGKGKGKALVEEHTDAAGAEDGLFDLDKLQESMVDSVQKLRISLKTVVGRVGRVSPDLLDAVRVEFEGKKRPLSEFATVSVKDGKDLLVTVYEESSMKPVTQALYDSALSLTPQAASSTSIRVPIPRPDWDKRQQLVRQAQDLCETARVAIRSVRARGQKEIKGDVDSKVATKDDGRNDSKKLDTATKKRTDEVDAIFEQAKKVLMDE